MQLTQMRKNSYRFLPQEPVDRQGKPSLLFKSRLSTCATRAARLGVDGKGIESRCAHVARRGPPAKRVRSWTEGSVGSASRDGTVVAKVVYEKYTDVGKASGWDPPASDTSLHPSSSIRISLRTEGMLAPSGLSADDAQP